MSRSLWKQQSLLQIILSSKTHQSFLQNPLSIPRPISTTSSSHTAIEHPKSLTLSYLTNTLGFSSDAALKASKRLNLKTTHNAESVLACFRNHGFTDAHIAKIINSWPQLLACNHAKVIEPKMDLLRRLGLSDSDLVKFICSNPVTLVRSLTNSVAPCLDSLKGIFGSDDNVVTALKCSPWVLNGDPDRKLRPNILTLQALGVPMSWIIKSMRRSLSFASPDWFEEVTETVKGLGLDPKRPKYLNVVVVMSGMDRRTWEEKCRVFRSFGVSEEETLLVFKKQPLCLGNSAKKIGTMLGFYVNELGWKPSVVLGRPTVLTLSLDKRVIPRCSVLKLLTSKGLLVKDFDWIPALLLKECDFLERFVNKYLVEAPELMQVYQTNMPSNGCQVIGLYRVSKLLHGSFK
ncbi:hypothetical protein QJS04_geneDACA024667 [Acorus gramineus]|uniref:Uncharacterized protein n=1 Tax=Acorus gramineus TaxID=55184 RepID=A0AAV8ZY08_ACOGR|nr:hypothetical protein QJS04_geneDACA024667 [Acorus gramineus]